jgi:hypothetical protein
LIRKIPGFFASAAGKKIANVLATTGATTGLNILGDKLAKRGDLKTIVKERGKEAAAELVQKVKESMAGGRRRRRGSRKPTQCGGRRRRKVKAKQCGGRRRKSIKRLGRKRRRVVKKKRKRRFVRQLRRSNRKADIFD